MPVSRIPKPAPVMVSVDMPCRHCSFNLRGLPSPGLCPECETPFYVGRPQSSNFMEATLDTLQWQARWMMLLACFGAAMGLAFGAVVVFNGLSMGLTVACVVLFVAAAGWAVAVTKLTSPWASMEDQHRPAPQKKVKGLRVTSCLLSVCTPAGGLVLVVANQMANGGQGGPSGAPLTETMPLAFGIACLLALLAVVGMAVLGIYFSLLADWYEDTDLGARFRASMVLALLIPVPVAWVILVPAGGPLTLMVWGIPGLGLAVMLFFFLRPFVQLLQLARWACSSAAVSHGHDLRSAKRIVERIERGQGRK